MSAPLWEVTGQFVCTASDTVICKLTTAGEPYAALIAGAPELLAERNRLKAANAELVKALKFYANDQVYEPDSIGRKADIAFVARAALAKHIESQA